MNIIKLISGALGLVFGVLLVLWLLGFVWSIIWYLLFFGIVGAIGYGAYSLFKRLRPRPLATIRERASAAATLICRGTNTTRSTCTNRHRAADSVNS